MDLASERGVDALVLEGAFQVTWPDGFLASVE